MMMAHCLLVAARPDSLGRGQDLLQAPHRPFFLPNPSPSLPLLLSPLSSVLGKVGCVPPPSLNTNFPPLPPIPSQGVELCSAHPHRFELSALRSPSPAALPPARRPGAWQVRQNWGRSHFIYSIALGLKNNR